MGSSKPHLSCPVLSETKYSNFDCGLNSKVLEKLLLHITLLDVTQSSASFLDLLIFICLFLAALCLCCFSFLWFWQTQAALHCIAAVHRLPIVVTSLIVRCGL